MMVNVWDFLQKSYHEFESTQSGGIFFVVTRDCEIEGVGKSGVESFRVERMGWLVGRCSICFGMKIHHPSLSLSLDLFCPSLRQLSITLPSLKSNSSPLKIGPLGPDLFSFA